MYAKLMLRNATKEVNEVKKEMKYHDLSALKGLLKEKNINYKTLSNATGISVSSINNKLNGFSIFSVTEVDKVVDYLEINPDKIVYYFFPHMLRNATIA